jgi:hypothetical protein
MDILDTSLPGLSQLVEDRLAVVGRLAESLEASTLALVRKDAEAIARGAAHQAELCRQWSLLENDLRRETLRRSAEKGLAGRSNNSVGHSTQLQAEWEALETRIRYLARVHRSLLRHLQRSLAVLGHLVASCGPTYSPDLALLRPAPNAVTLLNSAGE